MRVQRFIGQVAIIGCIVTAATTIAPEGAAAKSRSASSAHGRSYAAARGYHGRDYSVSRYYHGSRLQCVPFARENTGIELTGNAATWWDSATGIYERGARPEVGSVLNFRANGHMRLGHVAVVSNVIDGRNIEIDHANWAGPGASPGGISRNITVVDVSPSNDWSAVRVALGHTDEFGSIYPTYGFIYDRPDHGTMVANNSTAPAPVLNAAPRDLRPAVERSEIATAPQQDEEVAEAADDVQPSRVWSRRHGWTHAQFASSHTGYGTTRTAYGKPAILKQAHAYSASHVRHSIKRRA